MKIIEQSWNFLRKPDNAIEHIETAARTCYKSEDKIVPGSAEKIVKMLINKGHMAMIEHAVASIRIITNRGVTHELVRHRICSFAQESTRYVRYDGKMEFIRPVWLDIENGYDIINTDFTSDAAKFKHHPKFINSYSLHLILSKKISKNKRLIESFNKGFQMLKDSGKYDQYIEESRKGKYKKK